MHNTYTYIYIYIYIYIQYTRSWPHLEIMTQGIFKDSKGTPSSVYDMPKVSRSELATTHAMAPAATATRAFLVKGAPPLCVAAHVVSLIFVSYAIYLDVWWRVAQHESESESDSDSDSDCESESESTNKLPWPMYLQSFLTLTYATEPATRLALVKSVCAVIGSAGTSLPETCKTEPKISS
jgi:hypothetical protein